MTAKGRSLQVLTIAALLFAVTAKTGLAQQSSTPTNSYAKSAPPNPPGTFARSLAIYTLLSFWSLTPINFYGKVIDGEGYPIEGAKADIRLSGLPLFGGNSFTRTTDNYGLFSLRWKFGTDIIVGVTKDGYYTPPPPTRTFGYVKEVSTYAPHADPNAPAIFVLRKKGATEPLVMHSFHQAEVAKDGTPTNLDLQTGKETSGDDSIQIQVWLQKGQNPNEWKGRVSVPGGGMMERTGDTYNFQAPDYGYDSEEVIERTPSAPEKRSRMTKEYWFHFADGRYARATIEFYIGGFQNVCVTSYLNPQPSHTNLEYDTNQATTPTAPLHP
jgi:hypothetical protein